MTSNTPKIKIYRSGELLRETEGTPGETLLQRISAAGVFLDAPCGGRGKCGKCLVRLRPDGEQTRACQTIVNGDLDVYLPDELKMKIAEAGAPANTGAPSGAGAPAGAGIDAEPQPHAPAMQKKLGVAIDIGTTTVVAHLTDIETGARIATASGVNAQRAYGADVISRIQFCATNGYETLTRLIRDQISSLIRNTCAASGSRPKDIGYVSIAANTIMEHLAAGYSPVGMGTAPFTPVSLFGGELPAWEGLYTAKDARVYFAPAISSYVGGDITAGMLAAGLEDMQGPVVYLDIGTNGEIALKAGDRYYCCATAAGPAFEGAEITMGMAAVGGAVNHVSWDGGLKLSVIGEVAPIGLCGSGLLDGLALLLTTGAVDETGRMLNPGEIEHKIAGNIGEVKGKNVFWLTREGEGVYMSAADVRKLQLAKSAIAAGIQTLLKHTGISEDEVKAFVLAGGFGSYMDQYSAARIGLIPKSFLPVTKTLGNTAGEGAALAVCSESARSELSKMRGKFEYIELSSSSIFNEEFVEQMTFPE